MWWITAAWAQSAYVCANYDAYGQHADCNLADCDYCSLAEATLAGATDIQLAPGTHYGPAVVFAPQTTIRGEAAYLVAASDDRPAILVGANAWGARLHDLELVSNGGSFDGPLVEIRADDVELVRPTVTGLRTVVFPGLAPVRVVDAVDVRIIDPTIRDNRLSTTMSATALWVDASTVTVTGGEIADNTGLGPAVYARNSLLTFTGTRLADNKSSTSIGSQLLGFTSDVVLADVTVHGPVGGTDPAVHLVGNGTFDLVGGTVSGGGVATWSGLIEADGVSRVGVVGTRFEDHTQPALVLNGVDEARIDGAVFAGGSRGPTNGAVYANTVPWLEVIDTWFCDQTSDQGAGLFLVSSCNVGCTVRGSVFADSRSFARGGAIYADDGQLLVEGSTFVRNTSEAQGGAIFARRAVTTLRNSLVVDTVGVGPAVIGAFDEIVASAFGGNRESDANERIPAGNLVDAHPVFADAGSPCGGPVALADDPANRWLIENRVGAYTPCWSDGDYDGYGGVFVLDGPAECIDGYAPTDDDDCDDADGDVYPGADDAWYDGIDADCADNDDFDRDRDGLAHHEDCDDDDARIGRCGLAVGGGCAVGSGPTWAAWTVVLLLRRKRPVYEVRRVW